VRNDVGSTAFGSAGDFCPNVEGRRSSAVDYVKSEIEQDAKGSRADTNRCGGSRTLNRRHV
jgi:hypothetical protein